MQTAFPLLNLNANKGDDDTSIHYFWAPKKSSVDGMTEDQKKELEDAKLQLLKHSQRIKDNEDFVVKFKKDGIYFNEEILKLQNSTTKLSQEDEKKIQSTMKDQFKQLSEAQTQLKKKVNADVDEKIQSTMKNVNDKVTSAVDNKVKSAVQAINSEISSVQDQFKDLSKAQTQLEKKVKDDVDNTVKSAVQAMNSNINGVNDRNTSLQTTLSQQETLVNLNTGKLTKFEQQIEKLSTAQSTIQQNLIATIETNMKNQLAQSTETLTAKINTQLGQEKQTLEKFVDTKVASHVQEYMERYLKVRDDDTKKEEP